MTNTRSNRANNRRKNVWNRYGDRKPIWQPRTNIRDCCVFCGHGQRHTLADLVRIVRNDGTTVYVCQNHVQLTEVA
jgi:hypothetical protein